MAKKGKKWKRKLKRKLEKQKRVLPNGFLLNQGSAKLHEEIKDILSMMIANPKMVEGIDLEPKKTINEAFVQMELYRRLVEEGITVYPEYTITNVRCDLVVVFKNKIKAAIEVKKKQRQVLYRGSKQVAKYLKLGIPVIYCLGLESVEKVVNIVKENILKDKVHLRFYIIGELMD